MRKRISVGRAVLEAGESPSALGCRRHLLSESIDGGAALRQITRYRGQPKSGVGVLIEQTEK